MISENTAEVNIGIVKSLIIKGIILSTEHIKRHPSTMRRVCKLIGCKHCGCKEARLHPSGNIKECMACRRKLAKAYKKRNPHLKIAEKAKRRASKLNATPEWLTEEDNWMIREIYELSRLRTDLTGISWHVDHIVPLQGKNVCGLHVPLNMRVITAYDNIRKSNKEEGY